MKVLLITVFRVNILLLAKLQSIVFLLIAIVLIKIKTKKKAEASF
ncbi:MAG: hypothetical protein ACJASU_000666 [Cognaticolwellia sp.]|jgi:hypothetical protein